MQKRIFLGVLLFAAFQGLGQSFTVYNYSVPEGLPSSEVYMVYQDTKGFLWFATDNGITKFDGKEMETFQPADGLTDPVVFGFFEDKNGKLWLRTASGKLYYHENGKLHPYAFGEHLEKLTKQKYINSIYYDSLNQLWLSLYSGWGKIDANGNVTTTDLLKPQIFYKTIENGSICGIAWNSENMLTSLTINEKSFSISSFSEYNGLVCSIWWEGKFYIAFGKDVLEFDGKSVKKVLTSPTQVISLSTDREGHLWVGALHRGVQRYKHNDFSNPWVPEFLKEKSITKVLQDHENGLWITTLENGVFYIPNFLIENFNFSSPSKVRQVLATDSKIIIGNEQGTVTAINKKTRKPVWKKSFDGAILGLYNSKKNDLWIVVGGEGITIFDSSFVSRKKNIIAGQLLADFSGDTILNIGPASFRKFDQHGNEIFNKPTLAVYQDVLIDHPYTFLAKRSGGLRILDKNLELIDEPKEFSNFKITNILKLDESHLIIGTRGNGFLLVNQKTLDYRHYNIKNMFAANNIYSVVKIDSSIWLGTEKGIGKVSISSLLNGNPSFHFLTKRSGLVSDKIDFLLYNKTDVWAFYIDGFSVFSKDIEVFPDKNPFFYIKNITVNDLPIDPEKEITLPYNKNNIRVNLGFIAFNNQSIFIRHKLKKENSWNYSSNRNLEFYALAPGSYKLELEYSIDNNNWTLRSLVFIQGSSEFNL